VRGDHVDALGHPQPGRVRLDDVCRDALRPAREHRVEVGDAAVGDPRLGAGEQPVRVRGRGHRRDVRAGRGLRQGERRDRLAGGHARQVARALLLRAEQRDRPRPEALHGEREVGQGVAVGQRLARDAQRANVDLAHAVAQEAGVPEPAHERAAVRVQLVLGRKLPRGERRGELAVAVLEERPAKIHQSPSNAGRSFARKAW
jgi:hypothetical protein